MRGRLSVEFIYQLFALLVAVILVHALYVGVVRPQARAAEVASQIQIEADPDAVPEGSIWVVLRDYEQETCFILMLWAMALLAFKAVGVSRERALLRDDLVPVHAGETILPEDTREYARSLEAL